MSHPTASRLTALARLAACHTSGDQALLGRELRAAGVAGISWEACYEALLQLVAYTGYPRTINALTTFREVSGVSASERPSEAWNDFAVSIWPERGAGVFQQLWPGHELADSIRPVSAELAEWVINDDFGRLFGRPGLNLAEREAIVLGSLVAQRSAPQLRSHRLAFLAVGGDDAILDAIVAALSDLLPEIAIAEAQATLNQLRAESR